MARVRLKISASIHPDVLAEVDARGDNRSRVIERDLERYYELMREIRRGMRLSLGKREQGIFLELAPLGEGVPDWSWLAVLEAKGSFPRDLLRWFSGLSTVQQRAVRDAADRYWAQVKLGGNPEKRLFEEEE